MGLGKVVTRNDTGPTEVRAIDSFGGIGPGFSIADRLLRAETGGEPWEISGQSSIQVYRGIMSIPGVWRAVNLLADLLGGVPWDAYTKHGRDQYELVDPCPQLLEQPAPPDTAVTTRSSMALDLVVQGNTVAKIVGRDGKGHPSEIAPVPAAWSGVRRDPETGRAIYNLNGEQLDQDDVIHVKGLTVPGQLWGMGVLEAHFGATFRLARELNRQAADIGLNSVPTGVFQSGNPDMTKSDAAETKLGWQRSMRERSIAVIGPNDKFTPLSWNPEQTQLIQARQFSLTEIALIFGLPASLLNSSGGNSMTYSNTESDALEVLKFSLHGPLTRFEQAFTQAFPHGTVVRADLDSFLRADTLTRYQAYETGIQSGWLLRSEVRDEEKLKPIPGIDDAPQTDAVQLKLNKEASVTTPAILQPHAATAPTKSPSDNTDSAGA